MEAGNIGHGPGAAPETARMDHPQRGLGRIALRSIGEGAIRRTDPSKGADSEALFPVLCPDLKDGSEAGLMLDSWI